MGWVLKLFVPSEFFIQNQAAAIIDHVQSYFISMTHMCSPILSLWCMAKEDCGVFMAVLHELCRYIQSHFNVSEITCSCNTSLFWYVRCLKFNKPDLTDADVSGGWKQSRTEQEWINMNKKGSAVFWCCVYSCSFQYHVQRLSDPCIKRAINNGSQFYTHLLLI